MNLQSHGWVPVIWLALCALGCASEAANDGTSNEPEPPGDDTATAGAGANDDAQQPGDDPSAEPTEPEAEAEFPAEMLPENVLDSLELVPPKAGGRALFSDIVEIEPGEDVTFCTFIEGVTEEPMYIHNTHGTQSPYGHHAILYYTMDPQPAGTVRCTGADMETMRQVLGGTGGDGALGDGELPPNVVSEIPAGVQLVLNHHWIHSGNEAVQAQAEIVTEPAQSTEDLVVVRSFAFAVMDFNVPPGETAEHQADCTFEQDMDFLFILGHEHEWGTHVRAQLLPGGDESASEMIFDHDYGPDLVAHPDIQTYPLEEPLTVRSGDTLRMHCEWFNDTDAALQWPAEMCVMFGWKVGGERDAICVNGGWVSQ